MEKQNAIFKHIIIVFKPQGLDRIYYSRNDSLCHIPDRLSTLLKCSFFNYYAVRMGRSHRLGPWRLTH